MNRTSRAMSGYDRVDGFSALVRQGVVGEYEVEDKSDEDNSN